MTIYYVDPVNGVNANAGTSFALRKKDLGNVTATGGDEVRIIASADPVDTGLNGTWDSQTILSTSVNISSSTNANPIVITTSGSHGYSTGDTVFITGHNTNTNANGTYTITVTGATTFSVPVAGNGTGSNTGTIQKRNGQAVILSSSVVNNFGIGPGASTGWTGVTNSVVTTQTNTKEGNFAVQFAVAGGFTTGKIGFITVTSQNLSGFQQICFWIMQTAGTLASADNLRLRLCSDTAGDTVVNTATVPAFGALNTWYPIVVNLGTNLGTSIASLSLALLTDQGAQTFRIANPFVAKAASSNDSLTLNSMVSKSETGPFYHIQSIVGTRVMLDNGATVPSVARAPVKTSETVDLWKQEPLVTFVSQATTNISGSDGNLVTISGGWNRTDMSTQTHESVYDMNFRGTFSIVTSYWDISNISIGRANGSAFNCSSASVGSTADLNNFTGCVNTSCVAVASGANPDLITVARMDFNSTTRGLLLENTSPRVGRYGVDYIGSSSHTSAIFCTTPGTVFETLGTIENIGTYGILLQNGNQRFKSIGEIKNCGGNPFYLIGVGNNIRIDSGGTWTNNSGYAIIPFGDMYINDLTTSGHSGVVSTQATEKVYARNCTFNEANKILVNGTGQNSALYSQNNSGTGLDVIYTDAGTIQSDTTTRNTASGKSWSFKPTSTLTRNASYPLELTVATIAVSADSLVTVSAYLRRSNTALNMKLICLAGQIAGVTTDEEASITAAADTWEEVTITFTPTESGVVAIKVFAWGGTSHTGWVDDLTITQA